MKLASLLACSVLLSACGQSTSNGPAASTGMAAAAQSALTVAVTQPKQTSAAQTLDTAGGLFAWQEIGVGAEVSGYRVAEVMVDVGNSVRKGDILAKLDDTLLSQSLNQAEAAVAVAKATMDQAQASANRGNTLLKTNVISKQDVEQLNTTAATAAAQLISAESQLQTAKQRLDYAVIRAPDAGVISARSIVPGQIASAGSNLFLLIRQSRVEWRAEVSAADIGRVKPGMVATVQRADGSKATGKVRTVSPGIDAESQRGIAYVDLALEPLVRPGMYVSGSLQLAKANTLIVPLTAVSSRDGFSYVFVLGENNRIRQQRVTVGRLLEDQIELRDGVTAEDSIVVSGVGFLRDGDTVSIANASAASVPTNTSAAQTK